jgi:hypothetical protein
MGHYCELDNRHINGNEAGQIDEETGKLYFNQHLKGQTQTLEQGEPEQLASSCLLDAKLQKQGDKEELPASAFRIEMLRNSKDPWMGGEIIMSKIREVVKHSIVSDSGCDLGG